MSGRTTPLAEQPDWHPVHRANAMLHAALLSTHHAEPFEDRNSVLSLSRAIASVMEGPVSITYPTPLAARLDALAAVEDSYPAFEVLMGDPNSPLADIDEFGEEPAAEADLPLEEDPEAAWDDGVEDTNLDDEVFTAGIPLDPEKWIAAPQVHVQTLMSEFRRRQRQASLLVAGSIATAAVLTVGGLVLVASLTAPRPADGDQPPAAHSTSIAWQKPAVSIPQPLEIAIATNRAAKSEPLLVPGLAAAPPNSLSATLSAPQTILAASGREIAFGALLPPSHARYLLIRGLPAEATLSAGRDSGSGSWLVKGEHLHDLTLSLGKSAAGDYPLEVYALEFRRRARRRGGTSCCGSSPPPRPMPPPPTPPGRRPWPAWCRARTPRNSLRLRPTPQCCATGQTSFSTSAISPRPACSCLIWPSAATARRPTSSPAPSIGTCWPSSARAAWMAIRRKRAAGTSGRRKAATPRPSNV